MVEQIENAWPLKKWQAFRVLVAVSGGRDSVALLRALVEIRGDVAGKAEIFAGHFNHQLRGDESDGDEAFVRELCERWKVKLVTGESVKSVSDEASLREERYRFLRQTAGRLNCRYIVTAHHATDQVETVLFRIFRGTGIGGVGGIPQYRVINDSITIVRPMLECMPEDIDAAMKHWGQRWREDTSNQQSHYARNFLRKEVLPTLIERFGAKVIPNVLRLAKQSREVREFLRELATVGLSEAVSFESDGSVVVHCAAAGQSDQVVRRQMFAEIFRIQGWPLESIGFDELQRLADLVVASSDVVAFDLPGAVSCFREKGQIFLRR